MHSPPQRQRALYSLHRIVGTRDMEWLVNCHSNLYKEVSVILREKPFNDYFAARETHFYRRNGHAGIVCSSLLARGQVNAGE